MSGCHWLCQCSGSARHWQSQWHPNADGFPMNS